METGNLRHLLSRDFVLAFLSQFAFAAVFQLLIPTLPVYLAREGASETEIGILVGTFGLTSVFCRPLIGRGLARVAEKYFMVAGAFLNSVTSAAYLVIPVFWPLLFLRLLQGTAFAAYHTASVTFIAHISAAGNRARILGYFSLAMNFAAALAPPLGMLLINRFSFSSLFLACTALALCQFGLSCALGKRPETPAQKGLTDDGSLINRKAIPTSIVSSLVLFIWAALTAFFPLYAVAQGISNPGLFFTTMAVVLIVCRGLGGRILDAYSKKAIILPCLAAVVVAMVILAASRTQAMFTVVAVIWGMGHAFLLPTLMAYTLDRVASPGPAMGTFTAISDLGLFLGPLTMGVLVQHTSYPAMFLCLGFIGALNLGLFALFEKRKV